MSISENFRSETVPSRTAAKAPTPFSLRLSREERARLEKAAGGQPLGAFIREQLLGGDLVPRRTRGREPVQDHAALAKLLGALGRSKLASNLNQLAKAAHLGTLPVSEEVVRELNEACVAVRQIRGLLLCALGLREGGAP